MRIFISSVRSGLEPERDSLPGLIRAVAHEPVRFEDFGAQPLPSREACIRGVDSSDVYLLLLGPKYGHVFPETGQSATHDEWVAALTKGMPRLVFRKVGVDFEPKQEEFVRMVGDYSTGNFYGEFTDAVDLQSKVVQALRTLDTLPTALTYERLTEPVAFDWKDQWDRPSAGPQRQDPYVELHVRPLDGEPRSARLRRTLPEQLISALRAAGALPPEAGASPDATSDAVVVELPTRGPAGFGQTCPTELRGVRVDGAGQCSLWWSLPYDSLSSIIDAEELTATTARHLRLIGAMKLLTGERFALGIGLGGNQRSITEDKVTGVPRSRVSLGFGSVPTVRVDPDESVSAAAFDRGAEESAQVLVSGLLDAFRASTR